VRERIRTPPGTRLLGMGGLALLIHLGLVALLSLAPWRTMIQAEPAVYRVSLTSPPPSSPGPERPFPSSEPSPSPRERKGERPKKDDLLIKVKKPLPKSETPPEEKVRNRTLREALEDINKKRALDEMNRKAAPSREPERKSEESPPVSTKAATLQPSSPVAPVTPVKTVSDQQGPPSPPSNSVLGEYYGLIWAKIKEEWKISENLSKEMVDLETIIVVIIGRDGKVRKYSYEKKSGDSSYDEIAMRAIKRAEPLPTLPEGVSEDAIEIGLHFTQENYNRIN
jgi:colicin import membrane protein